MRGFGMADGLMSLVDAVNLNEDSSLVREVLSLEVGAQMGVAVLCHQTG